MSTHSIVCLATTANSYEEAIPANSMMVTKAADEAPEAWRVFWQGRPVEGAQVVANAGTSVLVSLDGLTVAIGDPYGQPFNHDGQRLTTPSYLGYPPAMTVVYDSATDTIS